MIAESSLIDFIAEKRCCAKKEYIFKQDQPALFYLQIASGEVKMNNYQPNGKEFIQPFFRRLEVLESLLYLPISFILPKLWQPREVIFGGFLNRLFTIYFVKSLIRTLE